MTLDDYQHAATRTINRELEGPERMLDAAAGLAEESGEILGIVRKHVYQSRPLDMTELEQELGDALWCLSITAASAGLSLERIAAANVEKLRLRYPAGYSDTASRNRTS
jgi:NTP pyrophosphatase (non-canonical NTP hydrolase)